ncbi:adaptor protein MecA [Bacillus tianshenii]|nr:adaptor protein MecA [Bacillus tianshenii]
MEIERINENTVKFYVTYGDIEDRGFDREEIWYNRERSEELFWDMMDEVHHKEEFPVEGPLWIQVQALEKGLEVIVTRAQLSKDGQKLELPISEEKQNELPVDEQIESMLDQQFRSGNNEDSEEDEVEELEEEQLRFVIGFRDFEDIISLAHNFKVEGMFQQLYYFENRYYLYIGFTDERYSEEQQDNLLSQVLEYGYEARITIHRIQEYGKEIMVDEALEQIRKHFPLHV